MKYFVIFSVSLLSICSSCDGGKWSKIDQDEFLRICFKEGGSKDYCHCFLEKMMINSPIADEAEQIDFESKVEIAKDCDL
ncbi:MAG: hypothetical protein AB8B74_08850 [Crocinitomicaceae bacterium]